jgi:predicted metal-dependent hydrolase
VAEEKKGMSKGCMISLIIVGIIVIIVIALSVVCYVNRDKIVNAVLDKSQTWITEQVDQNLPEEYTSEEAHQIISDFFDDVKAGVISKDELNSVTQEFQALMQDKQFSVEDARKLLDRMKEMLNTEPTGE